jgi:hypothetical protein
MQLAMHFTPLILGVATYAVPPVPAESAPPVPLAASADAPVAEAIRVVAATARTATRERSEGEWSV